MWLAVGRSRLAVGAYTVSREPLPASHEPPCSSIFFICQSTLFYTRRSELPFFSSFLVSTTCLDTFRPPFATLIELLVHLKSLVPTYEPQMVGLNFDLEIRTSLEFSLKTLKEIPWKLV